MAKIPQALRRSTRITTAKATKAIPKSFTCNENDWNNYLRHGSDQVNLQRSIWTSVLDDSFCGELDSNDPIGTLTTHIHDLYRPNNWILENFSNNTNKWSIIKFALKLATQLLTSSPATVFFRRLKYGLPRKAGDRMSLRYFKPKVTSAQDAGVRAELLNLAQRVKILFGVFKPEEGSAAQTHAMHCVSQSDFGERIFIRGNMNKLPPNDGQTHYLIVYQAYAMYASKSNLTLAETVRFVFSLAFTLFHETAHAFYARNMTDGKEDYVEPYYDLDQQTNDPNKPNNGELGFALEHLILKHSVQSTIHPTIGVEIEWEPVLKSRVDLEVVQVSSHQVLPVYTWWLHSFMQQEFWDKVARRVDSTKTFRIPRAMRGAVIKPEDKKRLLHWAVRRDCKWAAYLENVNHVNLLHDFETLENYERVDRVNLEIAIGRARKRRKAHDEELGVTPISVAGRPCP